MSEENAAFTATIKAGPGFEAPWIVVRGNTAEELKQRLHEAYSGLVGPLLATAEVFASEYQGAVKPANTTQSNPGSQNFGGSQGNGGFNGNQQGSNQGGGGTPGGNAPSCAHGPMQWKEGRSQAGKDYAGHFCTSRDRNSQCPPVWPPK